MLFSRRAKLIAAASLLMIADAFLLLGRKWARASESITYVGFDSVAAVAPVSGPWSSLSSDDWSPTLDHSSIDTGLPAKLYRITLAPTPTYGRFVTTVRALKKRGACNVVLREDGKALPPSQSAPDEPPQIEIMALTLCGNSLGDAGYQGELPHDS